MYNLSIQEGKYEDYYTDGIMTGKEWRFNGSGQITLGREKGSMVTTAPEDNSISRHQCVIDVVPPNVYVSDAGSTHGTYVNGQLIGKKGQGGQCPVRDGAEQQYFRFVL